ncbi:hypothetical protein [Pendulispora albinea]|uniref:Type II secretion system protein GspE N-terminal domain-containing protein n=1 Tax=Pendulispora albinea TaxID=2741071 RepID=A0ABZ2LZF7_9BACT
MARLRIGELLVSSKILSEEQLEEALKLPRAPGQRLGELLVARGLVTETQLTQTLGQQLSVPWVSLYHVDFSRQLLNLVPHELADRYCLVPIFVRRVKRQDTLYVAMADPTNDTALDEVARSAGLPARPMIGSPTDIRSAIRVYYGAGPETSERETPRPIPPPPPTNPEGIAARGVRGTPPTVTSEARPLTATLPSAAGPSAAGPSAAGPSAAGPSASLPRRSRGAAQRVPVAERSSVSEEAARPAPSSLPATVPAPAPEGERASVDRASADRASVDRASVDRASVDRASVDRASVDRASVDRASVDRASVDRASVDRASVDRASVPERPSSGERLSGEERPSTERPSVDSPDVDPEIEAREIYVNTEWRRPPMVEITLLDGTTLQLPARIARRRGGAGGPAGADLSEGLTARDLIRALRARAEGADARAVLGEDLRWEPLFAALLSLLMRKGLIADWEFIDEFRRVTAAKKSKPPPKT